MKLVNKGAVAAVMLATGVSACGGGGAPGTVTLPGAANGAQSSSRTTTVTQSAGLGGERKNVKRVLLISIDGMHGIDLQRYVSAHPSSTLASLSQRGTTYSNAHAPVPTDSFPGLLALVTGGHPASTGVYYEVSFDRSGYPAGSNCSGTPGTVVAFDESIDYNADDLYGGGNPNDTTGLSGINPATLTLAKAGGLCQPVFPHNYLRVNDIFEVVKAHGGRTAWSDKEESYEMLQGPSGHGVDDLRSLEINAGGTTGSEYATQNYDNRKVAIILNEIDGKTSTGVAGAGVPTLFGMNFQAVSVGQKLPVEPAGNPLSGQMGGYLDASGTPGPLLASGLDFVDASLGKFVAELKKNGLYDSTAIVVSAKHGQQPIDKSLFRAVSHTPIDDSVASNIGNGYIQTDDLALIWLQDRSDANEDSALANVKGAATAAQFDQGVIFTRTNQPPGWGRWDDPRIPDFGIEPNAGVVYTKPGKKVAEHGGFREDDTHVALLVSVPGMNPATIAAPVQTAQVAPTILKILGLEPGSLQAVGKEGTHTLPRTGGGESW